MEKPLAQENPAAGQRGQGEEGATVNSGIGTQGPAAHSQGERLLLFLIKLTSDWA